MPIVGTSPASLTRHFICACQDPPWATARLVANKVALPMSYK